MKHFIVFIVAVFAVLFATIVFKNNQLHTKESKPVLRIYASSSFISQWGPGPWLKDSFEATCQCKVEYFDSADSTLLLQRLKTESSQSTADLVLGFDQYDLEAAQSVVGWRKVDIDKSAYFENLKPFMKQTKMVPYDWGLLSFVVRKSELSTLPKKLDDFLGPGFQDKIALQDPRTSSPGLQFFLMLVASRGEEAAFEFLKKLNKHIHSYSTSWSMAYGLFTKKQVLTTYSYVTSPVYHIVEEKNSDVIALDLEEGHPMQVEFAGIPESCKNCELAEKFMHLILSKDGQKIIMEKNYMFPVINGVKEGTVFNSIPSYKIFDNSNIPSQAERERLLKRWSSVRRNEN